MDLPIPDPTVIGASVLSLVLVVLRVLDRLLPSAKNGDAQKANVESITALGEENMRIRREWAEDRTACEEREGEWLRERAELLRRIRVLRKLLDEARQADAE